MNSKIVRILWIAVYLVAIAFSIKNLKEPDIWWQLRMGEWIINNGRIPATDPLSYTFEGKEWTNIKWGYELLIAGFVRLTSPECIPILQALISCLIVFFILRTARLFTTNPNTFYEIGAAGVLLFLISAEYRMTGRPEMISHLFTIVYTYLLFKYLQQPSKLIFLLIPLQIVWSNMHEGYGIGLAVVVLFTSASWITYFYKRTLSKPIQLSVVALLTIISVICNPYGATLLLKPFALFKQVESTKFTTEFLDYTHQLYWQKETWLALAFALFASGSIVWNILIQRKKTKPKTAFYTHLFNPPTFQQIILIAAFVILASSAFRNVVLLSIVAMPMLIAGLQRVNIALLQKHGLKTNIALLVITAGLYIAVVSQQYYKFNQTDNRFGLEVLAIDNPDATSNYLRSEQLTQRVFSDYLTSSYLMWKLRPEFKSFIDLRDYEVFTQEFFQQYANAIAYPDAFLKLDSLYHFSAYVCFRQQFGTLHRFFYNNSNYSLTHLDAVTAVYKKTQEKKPVQYTYASTISGSALSSSINHILNPLYKSYDYNTLNEDQYVAGYYMMVGDEAAARTYIRKSIDKGIDMHVSYSLLGRLFLEKSFTDTSAVRIALIDSAQQYLRKALKLNPKHGEAYLGLGEIAFQQQLYKEAVKNFEKCIQYAPQTLDGYLYLGQCYKMLANQSKASEEKYLKLAIENYEQGNSMTPDNPIIIANLGFLYYRIGNCDKAVPYFEMVQDYPGLSAQERQSIKDCMARCR